MKNSNGFDSAFTCSKNRGELFFGSGIHYFFQLALCFGILSSILVSGCGKDPFNPPVQRHFVWIRHASAYSGGIDVILSDNSKLTIEGGKTISIEVSDSINVKIYECLWNIFTNQFDCGLDGLYKLDADQHYMIIDVVGTRQWDVYLVQE